MSAAQAIVATAAASAGFALVAQRASDAVNALVGWMRPSTVVIAASAMACAGAAHDGLSVAKALLLAVAAVNAITDVATGLIFDAVQCSAAIAVMAACYPHWSSMIAGSATASALVAVPFVLSRGRGFGAADLKFAALIGSGLGPCGSIQAIYFAFVSGGAAASMLVLRKRAGRTSTIAFGPFLAAGLVWSIVSPCR